MLCWGIIFLHRDNAGHIISLVFGRCHGIIFLSFAEKNPSLHNWPLVVNYHLVLLSTTEHVLFLGMKLADFLLMPSHG